MLKLKAALVRPVDRATSSPPSSSYHYIAKFLESCPDVTYQGQPCPDNDAPHNTLATQSFAWSRETEYESHEKWHAEGLASLSECDVLSHRT